MPQNGQLGAGSNYPVPAPSGFFAGSATAIAYGNFSGAVDASSNPIPDLLIAYDDGTVSVFQGRLGGGYALQPSTTVFLPSLTAAPAAIAVADFDNDGMVDFATANGADNTVSIVLNTRTSVGSRGFTSLSDIVTANTPVDIVADDFNGDGNVDLAIARSGADGSNNFNVTLFRGLGTGNFAGGVDIVVGTTAPADVNGPLSVASGDLGGANTLPEIVVGGTGGVRVLVNNGIVGGAFRSRRRRPT